MSNFSNILRNSSGEFEIGRTILLGASVAGVFSPIVFEAGDMIGHGAHFDVAAWCVAYPGGLAALITSGVLGIGNKEKNLADAKATQAATNATQAVTDAVTKGTGQ